MKNQVSPSNQAKSNRKVIALVLAIVGVLLVLVIGGSILAFVVARQAGHKVGETIEESSALIKDIGQYPDSYTQAGLPQYPNAEVTHLGRKDAKPTDGSIVIVVSSKDPVTSLVAFYDSQLTADGWVLKPESSTEVNGLVSRSYIKNGQDFNFLVQHSEESGSATSATITWQQDN